ncbi:hypothetical protein [[Phormidium] sp. ETS-05]|nr:hypothetical protein [[Phormidium] sp. ETS-05]
MIPRLEDEKPGFSPRTSVSTRGLAKKPGFWTLATQPPLRSIIYPLT